MKRIELPIRAITVENEEMGIDEFEDARALITIAHIIFVTEQPDNTTLISMSDGTDIATSLSYSDVKELLYIND